MPYEIDTTTTEQVYTIVKALLDARLEETSIIMVWYDCESGVEMSDGGRLVMVVGLIWLSNSDGDSSVVTMMMMVVVC